MSPRWDDGLAAYRTEGWLRDAMVLLSLDVTRAIAPDLGFTDEALAAARADLRRVLDAPLGARLSDPAAPLAARALSDALDPAVRAAVRGTYDGVIRYADPDGPALFAWGVVLGRCAREDALWEALELPPPASAELRAAYRAAFLAEDVQDRVEAALEQPLSDWDRRAATLRIFPPADDFGLSEVQLRTYGRTGLRLRFFRLCADRLGEGGLRALRDRAQSFLATQEDVAEAFGRLHDPRLLAHPEAAAADTPPPAGD